MKFRTIDEIISTTPEENVKWHCINIFGEEGSRFFKDISTLSEWQDRYAQFLEHAKSHIERMASLKKGMEEYDAKQRNRRWWKIW